MLTPTLSVTSSTQVASSSWRTPVRRRRSWSSPSQLMAPKLRRKSRNQSRPSPSSTSTSRNAPAAKVCSRKPSWPSLFIHKNLLDVSVVWWPCGYDRNIKDIMLLLICGQRFPLILLHPVTARASSQEVSFSDKIHWEPVELFSSPTQCHPPLTLRNVSTAVAAKRQRGGQKFSLH